MKNLKHFDLFSGYGGFSLALENIYEHNSIVRTTTNGKINTEKHSSLFESGNEERGQRTIIIGFSEIDKYASSVLKYHWPKIKNYGNIEKINWSEVPDFDIVTGGSPCQDLSVAGKQKGLAGERSGLFFQFIRCLKEKQPEYFIWENVKGALSSTNGWDFARVQIEFSEAGYNVWWQVLNAKDFGVPQNRERIFAVGVRRGSPREIFFEKRNSGENTMENDTDEIYKQTQKLSDAFRIRNTEGVSATLKGLGGGMGAKTGLYAILDKKGKQKHKKVASTLTGGGHSGRNHSDMDLIAKTIRVGGSKSPYGSKQNWDSYEIQGSVRRLTPTECERLMGLPDDWLKYGIDEKGNKIEISDSQKYKMAGNGVVVPVVEEVIKNLIL